MIQRSTDHPEPWEIHEAAKEVDGVDHIDDVSAETLAECKTTHYEVWEDTIQNNLKTEIDTHDHELCPNLEPRVVEVEYTDE